MLTRVSGATTNAYALSAIIIMGFGIGTTFPLYTIAVQNAVPIPRRRHVLHAAFLLDGRQHRAAAARLLHGCPVQGPPPCVTSRGGDRRDFAGPAGCADRHSPTRLSVRRRWTPFAGLSRVLEIVRTWRPIRSLWQSVLRLPAQSWTSSSSASSWSSAPCRSHCLSGRGVGLIEFRDDATGR